MGLLAVIRSLVSSYKLIIVACLINPQKTAISLEKYQNVAEKHICWNGIRNNQLTSANRLILSDSHSSLSVLHRWAVATCGWSNTSSSRNKSASVFSRLLPETRKPYKFNECVHSTATKFHLHIKLTYRWNFYPCGRSSSIWTMNPFDSCWPTDTHSIWTLWTWSTFNATLYMMVNSRHINSVLKQQK